MNLLLEYTHVDNELLQLLSEIVDEALACNLDSLWRTFTKILKIPSNTIIKNELRSQSLSGVCAPFEKTKYTALFTFLHVAIA